MVVVMRLQSQHCSPLLLKNLNSYIIYPNPPISSKGTRGDTQAGDLNLLFLEIGLKMSFTS
jgi:hypothetical protein